MILGNSIVCKYYIALCDRLAILNSRRSSSPACFTSTDIFKICIAIPRSCQLVPHESGKKERDKVKKP